MNPSQFNAASSPRLVNFYSGAYSIDGAPIQNIDASAITKQELTIKEGSMVFIRSANVFKTIENVEQIMQYYRSILSRDGKLHIYEPDAPELLRHDLVKLLHRSGFTLVTDYDSADDFAALTGNSVGNELNAIHLVARLERQPHTHDALLTRAQFLEKCANFRQTQVNLPGVSWVIAVYNEAHNLPHFLAFLENTSDETGMKREFIFVVNGCTDDSEQILKDFVATTSLTASLTDSEKGINPAFKKGIVSRDLNGFVGRFDADIVLHPQTLDLMQMHLVENEEAHVTYAEPLTLESETIFNTAAHHPEIMSKRLYYTGKTSLYRQNPGEEEGATSIPPQIVADDIFTSFNYIYRWGFEAISRTAHAVVYEKVIGNLEDLIKQTSRANSEISRIFEAFPHLKILGDLTQQIIEPSEYHDLLELANQRATYVEEWTRLESTK